MLSGNPTIFGIDPFSVGADPIHPLGSKGIAADGRIFRYAQAASTAIVTARLCVAPDIITLHEDRAFATAGAIGDASVSIAIGATAITANQYDEGYLVIVDDTGEGHTHKIVSHGTSAAGTENVTFFISPFLEEATTTSTTVTLVQNLYRDIVIGDTTQTDIPVGVTPIALGADQYGWVQTGGIGSVLSSGTNTATAGEPVTIGEATNGSLSGRDAIAEPLVGIALMGVAPTAGEHNPYLLLIDR